MATPIQGTNLDSLFRQIDAFKAENEALNEQITTVRRMKQSADYQSKCFGEQLIQVAKEKKQISDELALKTNELVLTQKKLYKLEQQNGDLIQENIQLRANLASNISTPLCSANQNKRFEDRQILLESQIENFQEDKDNLVRLLTHMSQTISAQQRIIFALSQQQSSPSIDPITPQISPLERAVQLDPPSPPLLSLSNPFAQNPFWQPPTYHQTKQSSPYPQTFASPSAE